VKNFQQKTHPKKKKKKKKTRHSCPSVNHQQLDSPRPPAVNMPKTVGLADCRQRQNQK